MKPTTPRNITHPAAILARLTAELFDKDEASSCATEQAINRISHDTYTQMKNSDEVSVSHSLSPSPPSLTGLTLSSLILSLSLYNVMSFR